MKIQTNNVINKQFFYSPSIKKGEYVSFASKVESNDAYVKAKQKHQRAREQTQKQRLIALASAVGLAISGAAGALIGSFAPNQNKTNLLINPSCIEESYKENDSILNDTNFYLEDAQSSQIAEEILATNSDVKSAYNKITKSIQTFSEHMGQDGLELILKRVDEIGNNKVNPLDVLKILYIESTGRVYSDVENKIILKNNSGATGPFQITKDTQDFVNNYYGFTGTDKELNYNNPLDNLDLCIYNLRFIADKRAKEIAKGENLPTGNNLGAAIMWGYHDGAWATTISDRGANYLEKYYNLSVIDEYPDVVDYILNGGE